MYKKLRDCVPLTLLHALQSTDPFMVSLDSFFYPRSIGLGEAWVSKQCVEFVEVRGRQLRKYRVHDVTGFSLTIITQSLVW